MVDFSVRLKEIRVGKRIKLREAAECLGMTLRNYQRYEAGETEPSIKNLIALADYFDVTLDYLMGRTDEPG